MTLAAPVRSGGLSGAAFDVIRKLVQDNVGICLSDQKREMLSGRLTKRLRATSCADFDAYVRMLQSAKGRDELPELIDAITTNVTDFHREPHHFAHFRDHVVPELRVRLARGEGVRVWSAGSSDGREVYTLAATILSVMPDAVRRDLRLLASDVDRNVLAKGSAGLYPKDEIEKLPGSLRANAFDEVSDGYQVKPALKRLVAFRQLNLFHDWPMKRKFKAIFCRNVLIYFDAPAQAGLLERFADQMEPGGFLYLGHSERLSGPAKARFRPIDITTYQLTIGRDA